MIGYKASYNQVCKNQRYEVGQTYTLEGELKMCHNGFHFCINPENLFKYYPFHLNSKNIVLFEVEAIGTGITEDNKSVNDKIKITRIIPRSEWNDLFKNYEFDKNGNCVYFKDSEGYEEWNEFDQNGNNIYYKNFYGYQEWYTYDQNNNRINIKNSDGIERWFTYDEYGQISSSNIEIPGAKKEN